MQKEKIKQIRIKILCFIKKLREETKQKIK